MKQNKVRLLAFEVSQIIMEKDERKTDIANFVVNRGSRVVAEVLDTAWEIKSAKEKLERSS